MADPVEAEQKPKSAVDWGNEIRDVVKASAGTGDEDIEDEDLIDEPDGKKPVDGEEEIEDVEEDGDEEEDEKDLDGDGKDKEDESDSKVRFSQFKGDGKPETYVKNLEEAYRNSSSEAVKLKDAATAAETERDTFKTQVEAIKTAVAKDPEFADKVIALLDEAAKNPPEEKDTKTTDSNNPYVKDAETKWKQENDQSAAEFAELNPEVLDDPILAAKVKKLVSEFGVSIYADEHRLAKAGELMEKAYGYLGLTVKKSEKQELVEGMKGLAAPTRKQAPKKGPKSTPKQFSSLTMDISKKMGISKDRLEKGVSKKS